MVCSMEKRERIVNNFRLFQLREIAIALTFIGGFIDAYTFVQRGGVLAAGQTGNVIFLSVDVAQNNLPGVLTKLFTMIFFCLGIIIVEIMKHKNNRKHYWRVNSLLAELIVCIVVGFLPKTVSNLFVAPPLALVMAMQNVTFAQIEGHGYNNVFATGNLKNAVIQTAEYLYHHRKGDITAAKIYFGLVFGFAMGAVSSALLQNFFGLRTIFIAAILIFIVAIYYVLLLRQRDA